MSNPTIEPDTIIDLWEYPGDIKKIRYPKYGLAHPLFNSEFINWAQGKAMVGIIGYDNSKQSIEPVNCTQSVLYGSGKQYLFFITPDDALLFKLTWL